MAVCIKTLIHNINLVIGCTNNCPYCYARCNCRRFHMTEDFSKPVFFERKLRLLDRKNPGIYLLTGMSDLADWKSEWVRMTLDRIAQNPENTYLFLTKSPDRLTFSSSLDNVWVGVTVTCASELGRLASLKRRAACKHYFITFEPLHESLGAFDTNGFEWVVVGSETGGRRGKITAHPAWVNEVAHQVRCANTPIFMKEELEKIMGSEAMIQELPLSFGSSA